MASALRIGYSGASMAEIAPLTPLRYDLERLASSGGLASVVAPPYDVIDPNQRAELAERHPHNVVKLILPEGEGDLKYANARDLYFAWRNDGVLVRDDEPAFYRYAQTFTPPATPGQSGKSITRRGFLGLVKIVPLSAKIVLPHEKTLSGPKVDRFKLFKATKTNFSPGFMLYRDPGRLLDPAIDTAKPLAAFTTRDGIRHELGKVTSRDALRAIVAGVAKSKLLIADGHHRYETAHRYMEDVTHTGLERAEQDYFLVFFANGDDPNLLVFPTHRHVHSLASFEWSALETKAAALFDVTPLPKDAGADVYTTALADAGKSAPSLVACAPDGRAVLLSLARSSSS
jgi:uncharacterized protein (DUF1015 family)